MNKRRSRFAPALTVVMETLEGRLLLSGIGAEVAAQGARAARTETKLVANAGTLGQPVTFNVTVREAAAAGAPEGTVDIIDHGNVIGTLTLAPAPSSNAMFAFSAATFTLKLPPGGPAYFFGKHAVSAEFIPSGTSLKSRANATFRVPKPAYTPLAGGVKIATIVQGSGPGIQSGQTANVLYTGYLEKNGHIFDDSIDHAEAPLSYTVGAGEVIPGFDLATVGMQVGESRIVLIPPAEGYGRTANGPIPGNSTLIFILTLESIS
jgi:peptidylprolyl isomerase